MEVKNCTNCGKELHDGEWVSKSGFCRVCAEKLIKQTEPVIFNKHWLVILLMCIFGGVFGIHRFATGKMGSGLIYLLTGGIFGIGVIVDIILIASNQFTEAQGEAIKMRIPNDFYREPSAPTQSDAPTAAPAEVVVESAPPAAEEEKNEKFKFRIAGVTFTNDDGSSRQAYLKEFEQAIEVGDTIDISYDIDTYDGKPRVKISFDKRCVGVIDASEVKKFIRISEKIEQAWPSIGTIESDSGKDIYYCYLNVEYRK